MFKNSKNHFEKFLILRTNFDSEQNVFSPYKSLQESWGPIKMVLKLKRNKTEGWHRGGGVPYLEANVNFLVVGLMQLRRTYFDNTRTMLSSVYEQHLIPTLDNYNGLI